MHSDVTCRHRDLCFCHAERGCKDKAYKEPVKESSMDEVSVAAEFGNHAEAVMARELLAAHGIESILHSDDCGGMAGGQTFVRGVQVLVAVEDLDRSQEILQVS